VMQVSGMEDDAQLRTAICQEAQQSHRIRSTRERDGHTHARLEQREVEGRNGNRPGTRGGHERMIKKGRL